MKNLSLALIAQGKLMDSYYEINEMSHAKSITIEIENLLTRNQMSIKDVNAIAVNKGPGSFTGLRVGSSVAKGLCFALDIPMIALDGLIEYGKYFYDKFESQHTDIFILLDARRDNYFYSHIEKGNANQETSIAHISEIEIKIEKSEKPWVNNSNNPTERVEAKYFTNAVIKKFEKKEFEDISLFEPNYIVNNYQTKKNNQE